MEYEKKHCLNCGVELKKHYHESNKRYAKKKYCTSKCARVKLKEEKRGWWSENSFQGKTLVKEVT